MKWKTMNLNRVICLCSFLIFFLLLLFINSLVFFFFVIYLFVSYYLYTICFYPLLELAPKPIVGKDSILD